MNDKLILEGDPFQIGFSGYTREQGEAILAGCTPTEIPAMPTCAHRGKLLEIRRCDLCGLKDQPFEVFACAKFGECSQLKRHSKVTCCSACESWIPLQTANPTATIPGVNESDVTQ